MWYLWCCPFVLSFLAKAGNINGGRSVDTPTPAALLILFSPASPSLVYQTFTAAAWWKAGSLPLQSSSEAAVESPWQGSLQPELLPSWRQPNSIQSCSLDSFAFDRMVEPRGNQSKSTVAGGYVCDCNTQSAFTGGALGSMRWGSVTSLRNLSTKLFGNAKRPAL